MAVESETLEQALVDMEVRRVESISADTFKVAARRLLMEPFRKREKPKIPPAVKELLRLQNRLDSPRALAKFNERLAENIELAIIEKLETTQRLRRSPGALGRELDHLSGRINAYDHGSPGMDRNKDRHLQKLVVAGCLACRLKEWEDAFSFLQSAQATSILHPGFTGQLQKEIRPLLSKAEGNMPNISRRRFDEP